MIALRPYQLAGIEAIREKIRSAVRRILFVLATGGGKTIVASFIVSSAIARGSRVLFVAHRRELIKQAFAKLVRNGINPEHIGIVMAGVSNDPPLPFVPSNLNDNELWDRYARRRPNAAVQIASIDTLRNRAKPPADLVIIDEAHRALARSYTELQSQYPNAVHLGLTATPYRADGKGLNEAFDDLVVIATPQLLINEGFLVEPRVFTVPSSSMPDLSGVRMRGSDYDEHQLAEAVNTAGLVGDLVEHWQRHAQNQRTVAFAVSVAHSQHIAARFRASGIAAEHLDGTTPTRDRDAILARLERGETLVVSNCGVLCEGWDQPSVKCAILARPTKSTGLYLQQAGRILRPYDNTRAVILDHAGCAVEHGLPQEDREFTLEGRKSRGNRTIISTRTCEQCYAVLTGGTLVCPECGFVFAARSNDPPCEKPGELVEVDPEQVAIASLRKRIAKITYRMDRERGWSPGETNRMLIRTFGKSRTKMNSNELAAVLAHLTTRFAVENPTPAVVNEIVEWVA